MVEPPPPGADDGEPPAPGEDDAPLGVSPTGATAAADYPAGFGEAYAAHAYPPGYADYYSYYAYSGYDAAGAILYEQCAPQLMIMLHPPIGHALLLDMLLTRHVQAARSGRVATCSLSQVDSCDLLRPLSGLNLISLYFPTIQFPASAETASFCLQVCIRVTGGL
jgi:hypothetical protein